jgi:2-dehydropantoate 2-reductase
VADIAVVGAGPVGSVVAATLTAGGHAVTVCEINDQLRESISRGGITLMGSRSERVAGTALAAVVSSVEELAAAPPEVLFLCVKATAIPLVASALSEVVPPETTIVSWQNGIDTEREIAVSVDPRMVVRAVVNYGVSYDAAAQAVRVTFEHPPHLVQELTPGEELRAQRVARILTDAGMVTERADHLERMVWRKAILNAALNALCGLTGMNMEEATRDSYAWDLADRILKESVAVARANEIWLGSGFYLWAVDYMHRAGTHRPSMLIDLEAGRRTEIDSINGKIAEYGRRAGVATPYNEALLALIKAREKTAKDRRPR